MLMQISAELPFKLKCELQRMAAQIKKKKKKAVQRTEQFVQTTERREMSKLATHKVYSLNNTR